MKQYPTKNCKICDKEYTESYYGCNELIRMQRDNICFLCAFWELQSEKTQKTVIDGCVYTPGRRTKGEFRGCAGRRFDIEYFDGTKITTYDLWVSGIIPDRWKDKISNTARFLNNAERAQVGDITCFNPSDGKIPPYPLPK